MLALILLTALFHKDIGCSKATPGREQQICRAISDSMEWTWMGHAIISPGWRVTWSSLRRVYCRQKLGAADLPALQALKKGSRDWRLESAADNLTRLLSPTNEPETSIFNPTNSQYILRQGCPGPQ